MSKQGKAKVFLVAQVPPDLRAAFAERFEIVDRANVAGWPQTTAPGIPVALTTGMHGFDSAVLDALPDVKLIASQGAGVDKLDLKEAHRRGIVVCHTPDELAQDVAECAIALTYAIMRKIAEADRFVRAGRWPKERMAPSMRVAGKKMGVVGLGRIGRNIARLAHAIGMDVSYFSHRPQPGAAHPFVPDLVDLAAQSDVLAIASPGGEDTRNLVGKAVLEKLGPKGFIVNISRGSVIDEAALLDALEQGTIAGAALDVFASEPNIDPRFLELENVVLQPHSSSITHETRAAMIGRLMSDVEAFLSGKPFYDAAAPKA
jgi:hydroxypyruvate reductase